MLAWLINGVVHGTVLAAVAWVVTVTLLRHARPATHAAVWTVVLARFLLPFEVPVPVAMPAWAVPAEPSMRGLISPPSSPESSSWQQVALALWGLGVTVLMVRRVGAAWRLWRFVRALPDDVTSRSLRIKQSDTTGPFVFGLLRPTIVLPVGVAGETRAVMLAHERAHLSRGDPWWLLLQHAAEMLFFFWPPVHLVTRRLTLAREQACDEAALRTGALSPADYASLLLDWRHGPTASLAMSNPQSLLERRIHMVLSEQARSSSWWVVVVLAGVGLLGTAAAPNAPQQGTLEPARIQRVFVENKHRLRACDLRADATQEQQVELSFIINARGTVEALHEGPGTSADPALLRCVLETVSWFQFPRPTGGSLSVTYPLRFGSDC